MAKIIEAKAIISAADKTGNVFDKIAAKIKGVEKTAKAFGNIKAPAFTGNFNEAIAKLKATEREMQAIRKSWASFDSALRSGGPMKASRYLEAVDMWKSKTLAALRQVKAGYSEVEQHQNRFFRKAGHFALAAAGVGGGAYVAERGVKAGVKSAAERSREMARYGLAGLSDEEKTRANAKADEVAARNPSISRTEILGHIRQLRARLGSFDHAIENVEALTQAQTVLATLGHGGEHGAEDLEKLVLGLESQGVGSNPEKFRTYLNAFVKAKSLFPDLTGEKFQQYMQTSNASKYGLSEDYLTTVAPTMMQHNRAPNFGVEQSSAFSALIGGRQTKEAKAAMKKAGLLDKTGKLADEKGFVANPYAWTLANVKPALKKQGVSMDEEHKGDLVTAVTKMFSNRKVADFIASMLVNESVIEKDKELLKHAKGTEGADQARKEDAFQASQSISTQLKDAAAAFLKLQPVIDGMNALATKMSQAISKFDTATPAEKIGMGAGVGLLGGGAAVAGVMGARSVYQWFTGGAAALTASATALDASAAALTAAAARLAAGSAVGAAASAAAGAGGGAAAAGAGAAGGSAASKLWGAGSKAIPFLTGLLSSPVAVAAASMVTLRAAVDDARYEGKTSGARMKEQRGGKSVRQLIHEQYSDGEGGAAGAGTPVQAELTGSAKVEGETTVKVEVTVTPSSELVNAIATAKGSEAQMRGMLNANGPGSTGRSSPDAAAPSPRGNTGSGGAP